MFGMLPASRVMGLSNPAESMAMLWPWFARTSQWDGSVDVDAGSGEIAGFTFMENRCLELSATTFWMSVKVALRDLRWFQLSCQILSQMFCESEQ